LGGGKQARRRLYMSLTGYTFESAVVAALCRRTAKEYGARGAAPPCHDTLKSRLICDLFNTLP